MWPDHVAKKISDCDGLYNQEECTFPKSTVKSIFFSNPEDSVDIFNQSSYVSFLILFLPDCLKKKIKYVPTLQHRSRIGKYVEIL